MMFVDVFVTKQGADYTPGGRRIGLSPTAR